jgi:dTDP-4-dehydrorhamnose reductase
MAINARAPGLLAEEAARSGAVLLHYSTDYVFDGAKGSAYLESDLPHPINVYGRSKLMGEQAVVDAGGASIILRTSWVYSLRRDSFVTKTLSWSRQQTTLRVVQDQIGCPTWARMLAEITAALLARGGNQMDPKNSTGVDFTPFEWLLQRQGIYHMAGDGNASRLDWAKAILRYDSHPEEQSVKEVLPALTADFPTPAQRPLYSALCCDRFFTTFGLRLPAWETSLRLAMESAL